MKRSQIDCSPRGREEYSDYLIDYYLQLREQEERTLSPAVDATELSRFFDRLLGPNAVSLDESEEDDFERKAA